MLNTCFYGDCRETMRRLISEGVKVQMCVTSPPYWNLRDYGHPEQLGLEKTPGEYVQHMVEVFRLVKELLRDDGTCWVNLGDSYAGSMRGYGRDGSSCVVSEKQLSNRGSFVLPPDWDSLGLKPKDLCGIPWRVAFALQADGWYLRSDIIWSKPNPMPESVTDRPTKAHEYLFLLAKSQRYYFDQNSVREEHKWKDKDNLQLIGKHCKTDGDKKADKINWIGRSREERYHPEGRNIRSVWTIPTHPTPEAHFATYPEDLIVPCIKAGSREGDIVLDPFFGSGTTGKVCIRLGRKYIGCELQENYKPIIDKRTAQQGLL